MAKSIFYTKVDKMITAITRSVFLNSVLALCKLQRDPAPLACWSLYQLVVETLGVASVRPFVRTFVRNAFSRKPLITFF